MTPGFSVQEVADLRAKSRSLEAIVEYHSMSFNLLRRGEPQRVQTGVVSANYFDALGVTPLFGRTFRAGRRSAWRDARRRAELPVLARTAWRRHRDHRQDRRDDGSTAYRHRHPAAAPGVP